MLELVTVFIASFLVGGLYLFICRAGYKRGYHRGYYDGHHFGVEDAKEEYHSKILLDEYEKRRRRQAAIKQADHLRVVK